jgi:hypothetical protein
VTTCGQIHKKKTTPHLTRFFESVIKLFLGRKVFRIRRHNYLFSWSYNLRFMCNNSADLFSTFTRVPPCLVLNKKKSIRFHTGTGQ